MRTREHSPLFEEIILKSWWVILFFLLIYFLYDEGARRRNLEKEQLAKKLAEIHVEIAKAKILREELTEQIASQNDPAWIELMLMKGLGLVPEGERKVYFLKEEKKAS